MSVTDWIQALSAATVAVLTFFLWRVTTRYTNANDQMVRAIERDIRERYRPSLESSCEIVQRDLGIFTLDTVLYNRGLAPLRVDAVRITHGNRTLGLHENLVLAVGEPRTLDRVRFATTELLEQEQKEGRELALNVAIEYRDFHGVMQRVDKRPWDDYMARQGRPPLP